MLFACTCAADASVPNERVPAGLRGMTAGRAALQLTRELAGDEQLWRRALGRRYDSVRHRYARRTTWRTRGLAELMRDNEAVQGAVNARLQRWLTTAHGSAPSPASSRPRSCTSALRPASPNPSGLVPTPGVVG